MRILKCKVLARGHLNRIEFPTECFLEEFLVSLGLVLASSVNAIVP
jgi:hypothetical protein